MSQAASGSVVRQWESLLGGGTVAGLTDRQLIDRFNARRDAAGEAAFAAMVHRHGPMVLDVCRQLLGDRHHAEDAFQAVFLVLARKAGSLRDPDRLGPWLYGVAIRTARKSRARLARLRRNEEGGSMRATDPESGARVEATAPPAEESAIVGERAEALHDEIDRLPRSFRLPVVLCYFEGLTLDEAARRLDWPAGTVRSRLARARDKLRDGLTRRGVVLPAAAIAAALTPRPAAASVPPALCEITTRAAIRFVSGQAVSASASALAREVLRSMLRSKVGFAAMTALGLAAGAGLLVPSLLGRGELAAVQPVPGVAVTVPVRPRDEGEPRAPSPAPKPQAPAAEPRRPLSPWGERVERAIREGVRFLKSQQQPDGSWTEAEAQVKTGTTSLVTLALIAAGERVDSPAIQKSLDYLRAFGPNQLRNTYAIGLQTMALAAAEPERDRLRMIANVDWLEQAQLKPGDRAPWPGTWTYSENKAQAGDHSNTQYALLGLNAAGEAGIAVKPETWALSRTHFEKFQLRDGGWGYTPRHQPATGSMTCAGISSLIIAGSRRYEGQEFLQGETIRDCGRGAFNGPLLRGVDWLSAHFQVGQNYGHGQIWKYYYLCGMERAGRLAGIRFFGLNDWYRLGAEELVHDQDPLSGFWRGANQENELVATSLAQLFLAKGRAPVLIHKLRHHPLDDWDRDPEDLAHLVDVVGRDWKRLLTWQVVNSGTATVPDLLRAPILFLNGHKAPEFTPAERATLRDYVDRGGFLFAEACCGAPEFDEGFRRLMKDLFPEDDSAIRPLPEDHPIWRVRNLIDPASHPLWGIRRGARTAVVYSPSDLSCYWNQMDQAPRNPAVLKAIRLGQNVIEFVTRREVPPDKLAVP